MVLRTMDSNRIVRSPYITGLQSLKLNLYPITVSIAVNHSTIVKDEEGLFTLTKIIILATSPKNVSGDPRLNVEKTGELKGYVFHWQIHSTIKP